MTKSDLSNASWSVEQLTTLVKETPSSLFGYAPFNQRSSLLTFLDIPRTQSNFVAVSEGNAVVALHCLYVKNNRPNDAILQPRTYSTIVYADKVLISNCSGIEARFMPKLKILDARTFSLRLNPSKSLKKS
jgi:hypothetical protein